LPLLPPLCFLTLSSIPWGRKGPPEGRNPPFKFPSLFSFFYPVLVLLRNQEVEYVDLDLRPSSLTTSPPPRFSPEVSRTCRRNVDPNAQPQASNTSYLLSAFSCPFQFSPSPPENCRAVPQFLFVGSNQGTRLTVPLTFSPCFSTPVSSALAPRTRPLLPFNDLPFQLI